MTGLSDDDFKPIVRNSPLLAVDLIIKNKSGELLLGLRNNQPARGKFFVPGGCVRKDETISQAFMRILREETGISFDFDQSAFMGVFEQFYPCNRFSEPGYGTHYVALVYKIIVDDTSRLATDQQHACFRWMVGYEANAHPYTKPYFDL